MKTSLSSRERILCTIAHEEPDHIPLWSLWTADYLPSRWQDPRKRVREVLELGLDDSVRLSPPWGRSSEVWTRCWMERPPGSRYPLLVKEHDTPKGTLRQVVRRTADWPHGDDILIFSDHNVSRSVEFPVKGREDLPKLAYLFPEPTAPEIEAFREEARTLKQFADGNGVLVEGGWISGGDGAVWLCGVTSLALQMTDDPGFVEELLDILLRWQLRRTELLLDVGVDTLVYRAWYEMPDFWSLWGYRRFLKPIIGRHIELAHQAGVPFTYILTKGVMPLRFDFLDLGIDSLWGVDPVQDKADLAVLKQDIGDQVCLWGGLNAAVTLGRGTLEEIRTAVTETVHVLGPGGGFVLMPVDQIFDDTPWESVMVMIERWREIGEYPLTLG